jgi:glycosyltransferase involved in cell wall biosynthesis
MLQGLQEELTRDHAATQVRLAEIDNLMGTLREQVERDPQAHLAEIGGAIGELRRELVGERDAASERITKLELLLEHPDVFAVSREESPFTSPVVSIVMPTWNRGRVIGAAIRSVQAQRFSDWELIVVDDGSTDDTAAVMSTFAQDTRIRYFRQEHAGQCKARNHGLTHARGRLIAYLDSDNVWYPGFLAAAAGAFAAKPETDCLYGAMVTDAHGEGERVLFRPFDRDRLLAGNYIGTSTFMHRRELIARYGAWDEDLDMLEDWDLILRYTAHAPPYRLPALAVRYRVVDATRVSVTADPGPAAARIRAKWIDA